MGLMFDGLYQSAMKNVYTVCSYIILFNEILLMEIRVEYCS